ncbi:MAG: ribosome silencing factor [Verrucomicrobia bacterium]|nr:ribosome silencing factor [Verrucomicrobiota bacterium]MBS0638132.1 ribosome silencing factor [Verrucomicrobiota bacterium]
MINVPYSDQHFLEQICQILFDKKGFNILTLDVRSSCTFTDYFVIAEGTVEKHVQSLAKQIIDALAEEGRHPIHAEGQRQGDWIVLDYSEVVIHLFTPDMREKYELEQLWQNSEIVDVSIQTKLAGMSR